MFVYGRMYIYKQGFPIRGKKRFLVVLWPEGPTSWAKASGPHREWPHPLLLPGPLLCSEDDQCRNCLPKQWAQCDQSLTKPLSSVSGGLGAAESLLQSQRNTVEKEDTDWKSEDMALCSGLSLDQGGACGRIHPFKFFVPHFPSFCKMMIRVVFVCRVSPSPLDSTGKLPQVKIWEKNSENVNNLWSSI